MAIPPVSLGYGTQDTAGFLFRRSSLFVPNGRIVRARDIRINLVLVNYSILGPNFNR